MNNIIKIAALSFLTACAVQTTNAQTANTHVDAATLMDDGTNISGKLVGMGNTAIFPGMTLRAQKSEEWAIDCSKETGPEHNRKTHHKTWNRSSNSLTIVQFYKNNKPQSGYFLFSGTWDNSSSPEIDCNPDDESGWTADGPAYLVSSSGGRTWILNNGAGDVVIPEY